jgi:MFS transporter, NNP family, nitrate/nitrite transporter
MDTDGKATQIKLLNFSTPSMRAFHMAWLAFFLCFFAWFGIAPLMPVVRAELELTKEEVGWCIIGSVAMTIFARLLVGWLCDRYGPRLTYTWLLLLGSVPVMSIGLAHDFRTFLLFRVAIGAIGASFVITQYHASRMFAANCVGTANATAAGWGNLGGGVTQLLMPILFALFAGTLGLTAAVSWRLAMFVVGLLCAATGVAYFFLTQDTPEGNFRELRTTGRLDTKQAVRGAFWEACRDHRVWALFLIYGASFGMELTIDNIAVLYFFDYFDYFQQLDQESALRTAGMLAAMFGGMNLFARAIGGWVADRCGNRWGLDGRVKWLFIALFGEGIGLMLFAQATTLTVAIPLMIAFAMFVKMSNGATYAVVPFVNRRALGAVSGIVGAGGNAGAVVLGFLFKSEAVDWHTALFVAGTAVTCISFASFLITFREQSERDPAVHGAKHEPISVGELSGAA